MDHLYSYGINEDVKKSKSLVCTLSRLSKRVTTEAIVIRDADLTWRLKIVAEPVSIL
jgi:hypothetical protein